MRSSYKGIDVKGMVLMIWDMDGSVLGSILPSGVASFLSEPHTDDNVYGELLGIATIYGLEGYIPISCGCGGSGWLCRSCADIFWENSKTGAFIPLPVEVPVVKKP
jgi:hypothetical protein